MPMTGSHTHFRADASAQSRVSLGYFVEVDVDDAHGTADPTLATHGLIDTTGEGDGEIVPLASVDGSATLLARPDDTLIAY